MKRATVCLLPLLLLGCQQQPPAPAVRPEPAPQVTPSADPDDRPLGRITAHPWWQVEVGQSDVEKIVDAVRAQGRGTLVLVDRHCHLTLVTDHKRVARFRADRKAQGKDLPDQVYFDPDDYRNPPGWARVLKDLKERLDRAEQLVTHPAEPAAGPKAN
jgi:hypothetical protein